MRTTLRTLTGTELGAGATRRAARTVRPAGVVARAGAVGTRTIGARAVLRPRLDGACGQAGARNDTLLGAVETDAESPAVVVLMEKADELAGAKFKLIVHGGLEVELNAMNHGVGGSAGGSNGSSA
jgi:hypothetical protein